MGIDPTRSIPATQAMQLYGVTKEDLNTLDANNDGKITVKEFQNWGIKKNSELYAYFTGNSSTVNQKSNPNFSGLKNITNPFERSLKSNFARNYNEGQLSPRVDSDLGKSPVGNVLPNLYV